MGKWTPNHSMPAPTTSQVEFAGALSAILFALTPMRWWTHYMVYFDRACAAQARMCEI